MRLKIAGNTFDNEYNSFEYTFLLLFLHCQLHRSAVCFQVWYTICFSSLSNIHRQMETEHPMWVQRIVSAKISTYTGIELGVVMAVCGGRVLVNITCARSVRISNSCEADTLKYDYFFFSNCCINIVSVVLM